MQSLPNLNTVNSPPATSLGTVSPPPLPASPPAVQVTANIQPQISVPSSPPVTVPGTSVSPVPVQVSPQSPQMLPQMQPYQYNPAQALPQQQVASNFIPQQVPTTIPATNFTQAIPTTTSHAPASASDPTNEAAIKLAKGVGKWVLKTGGKILFRQVIAPELAQAFSGTFDSLSNAFSGVSLDSLGLGTDQLQNVLQGQGGSGDYQAVINALTQQQQQQAAGINLGGGQGQGIDYGKLIADLQKLQHAIAAQNQHNAQQQQQQAYQQMLQQSQQQSQAQVQTMLQNVNAQAAQQQQQWQQMLQQSQQQTNAQMQAMMQNMNAQAAQQQQQWQQALQQSQSQGQANVQAMMQNAVNQGAQQGAQQFPQYMQQYAQQAQGLNPSVGVPNSTVPYQQPGVSGSSSSPPHQSEESHHHSRTDQVFEVLNHALELGCKIADAVDDNNNNNNGGGGGGGGDNTGFNLFGGGQDNSGGNTSSSFSFNIDPSNGDFSFNAYANMVDQGQNNSMNYI
jgi:hypothetical protein